MLTRYSGCSARSSPVFCANKDTRQMVGPPTHRQNELPQRAHHALCGELTVFCYTIQCKRRNGICRERCTFRTSQREYAKRDQRASEQNERRSTTCNNRAPSLEHRKTKKVELASSYNGGSGLMHAMLLVGAGRSASQITDSVHGFAQPSHHEHYLIATACYSCTAPLQTARG